MMPATTDPSPKIRLWPGVAAAALILTAILVIPLVAPGQMMFSVGGGAAGAVAVIIWWLFFSRAPWFERIGAIILMAFVMYGISRLLHPSIQGGMMGMMPFIYGLPTMTTAFVLWAVLANRGGQGVVRYVSMAAFVLMGSGLWTLLRTDGITGTGTAQLAWRWTPSAEERLIASQGSIVKTASIPPPPTAPTVAPQPEPAKPAVETPAAAAPVVTQKASDTPAEWPGFRGPKRDSVVHHGVRINTDWTAAPPKELWRKPVGPGWSSFAVQGDLAYTQEQRGEQEVVTCFKASTGDTVWAHADTVRFYESNAGAGPRGTPTVVNGQVYALGATGILNALDARTGARLWARNTINDTGAKIPGWGIASSPLVVGDNVIVATSGHLAAYDVATGTPKWKGPTGGGASYSSPHLVSMDGVTQVVFGNNSGLTSFAPADGKVLWKYGWEGTNMLQPAVATEHDLLIPGTSNAGGSGTRRLAFTKSSDGWTVTEGWTSSGLKPYFNDFVVHNGHAFGFDGAILSCIDLQDGKRKWKGGRYGHGQMVLLADQDMLLVLSEEGEIALVQATPGEFKEVAKVKAIEGKTWNHPVLVGDLLLVRNGEEMAAFRLPRTNAPVESSSAGR
jgi:outer membrane protein assembly factor BamB